MFCSECGKQVNNEAKFCANCGTKQDEQLINIPAGIQTTDSYNTEHSNNHYNAPPSNVTRIESNANHTVDINNKGKLNTLVAILLPIFFNSLGLFYASVTGGVVMTSLNVLGLVVLINSSPLSVFYSGGGIGLFFFGIWFGSIIWAAISTK